MKKTHLFGMLLMAFALSMGFTSCEKDDGSACIEMRMRNDWRDRLRLLTIPSPIDNSNDEYVQLIITSSNNFYVSGYGSGYGIGTPEIVCVGNVSGLNGIKDIPNSGWTEQVAVQPGQGYIIRRKPVNINDPGMDLYYSQFCTYARVYVVDWLESTSGGIIGAIIRYQDNWK